MHKRTTIARQFLLSQEHVQLQRKQPKGRSARSRPELSGPRKPRPRAASAATSLGVPPDWTLLNNSIDNLLAGTGIATVFVDRLTRILRFTPWQHS